MWEGKAAWLLQPDDTSHFLIDRTEAREPGENEITVRLEAASLNYHDWMVMKGMGSAGSKRIPLSDAAGKIVAVGSGVTEFKTGDQVVSTFFPTRLAGGPVTGDLNTVPGDGIDGYARQFVTLAATAFTHSPVGWSATESATLPTAGLTAWRALTDDAKLKAGDTVVVQGTGGVSLFALQFSKIMGATVIATSSSEAKLQRLTELGADYTINYRQQTEWGEIVKRLTQQRGADVVIDVGGPATLEQSMQAAKLGGHIALIGILSGFEGNVPFIPAISKQLRLQGGLVGNRQQQQEMIRAINVSSLKPVIDNVFPLENIDEAFAWFEQGQHMGKIVLNL